MVSTERDFLPVHMSVCQELTDCLFRMNQTSDHGDEDDDDEAPHCCQARDE